VVPFDDRDRAEDFEHDLEDIGAALEPGFWGFSFCPFMNREISERSRKSPAMTHERMAALSARSSIELRIFGL